MIVNQDRGREVHLPGMAPTTKANSSYFRTFQDDTQTGSKYYKSKDNLPWSLNLLEPFEYPIEGTDITGVYYKFSQWAESGGVYFKDWYQPKTGYRQSSLLFN